MIKKIRLTNNLIYASKYTNRGVEVEQRTAQKRRRCGAASGGVVVTESTIAQQTLTFCHLPCHNDNFQHRPTYV